MIRMYLTLTTLVAAVAGFAADGIHRFKTEEEGLTTTEIAVVTFLLVGAAIVVMGIIYVAARNNAENIPVPDAPA
jgi:hypothetical protein